MNIAQLVHRRNIGWIDLTGFTLITALAVLNGTTTVFYVLYLFWWHELIARLVASAFRIGQGAKQKKEESSLFSGYFLLFIYLIFILIFFGLFANWDNQAIMMANFKVLFFQDWFFNANLLFMLVEHIWLNVRSEGFQASVGPFSPNLIVLHISIILGALMLFMVVRNFPDFFSPDNLLGSLLVVMPFLLLRLLVQLKFSPEPARSVTN